MRVIRGLRRLGRCARGSVVTVGVFDGVHAGHRKIIGRAVRLARELGLASVVVTFDPHPATVLRAHAAVPRLVSLAHRIRLIAELGVDTVVVIRFTPAFARTGAEAFVRRVLAGRLRARVIVASEKFYFGRGASAGIGALQEIATRNGIAVRTVPVARTLGRVIGSSLVRDLIGRGDLRGAQRCLGRPVSVLGTVVRGSRLGRTFGYPTANINPHHEVVPPSGVYAVQARIGRRSYRGILNIGVRPTFYGSRDCEPEIECHIFGFRGNIYGRDLEVLFLKKLREEVKFKNSQELVAQIRRDIRKARAIVR